MRRATRAQHTPFAKMILSPLLALMALGVAVTNTHGVEVQGTIASFVFGSASVIVALLILKDVLQRRSPWWGAAVALTGMSVAALACLLASALLTMERGAERRLGDANHLKQIAQALREYDQEHGRLPPAAATAKDGTPLLSWRVLILPYLERDGSSEPGLFQQFRLDEAWDGPHNLPLLSRMPKVYAAPVKNTPPDHTHYQVFVGKGTAFEGSQGVRLADFPDGVERTILVTEATPPVPWTKPADLDFGSDMSLPQLGVFREHFNLATADGSVHYLPTSTPGQTLRALITRNGADTLPPDWDW
jgi:hypothetical protein